jgi:hypothetical protein
MRTTANLEQNLLVLNRRVNHLQHIIKVLKGDGKNVEKHEVDLADVLATIEQVKKDIAA